MNPVKFAFEIYDSEVDNEYADLTAINEGYLMFYRKFKPITILLYAEKEERAKKLLSSIREDKFILFVEPRWRSLLNFPNSKIYPELLIVCRSPIVFKREDVRELNMKDSNEILKIYGKERGNTLLQMIKKNELLHTDCF